MNLAETRPARKYARRARGYGQETAELKEAARELRTKTVYRIHKQAKARRQPLVPDPTLTVSPPEGTLGWIRRQGNALIQELGRRGVKAHVILVAVIMANCSNELGETDVGIRRICEIAGATFDEETGALLKPGAISPRCVTDAWAVFERIRFFTATVPIPDVYDPRAKRRAGTWHRMAMPTDEQLSLMFAPLPREPDRQTALPFVPTDAPAVDAPAAAPRPASPPHVGGEGCQCRPCVAREAVPEDVGTPVASSAREATVTEALSETVDGTRVEAVTSRSAMLPTGAANAAIDAAPEPRLTSAELAHARRIDREIDRQSGARHALPRTPQVPGRGIDAPPTPRPPKPAPLPTAFALSVVTEYVDGRKVRRIDTARLNSFFIEPQRRAPEPEPQRVIRANREPTDPELE